MAASPDDPRMREDLLSSVQPMPGDVPVQQQTDQNMITRNDDGTITVMPLEELGQEFGDVDHEEEQTPEDWNENLAYELSPQERMRIADELVEFYSPLKDIRTKNQDVSFADAKSIKKKLRKVRLNVKSARMSQIYRRLDPDKPS